MKGGENMSISDLIVKIIGVILAIVGLSLVLSAVGINFLGVALAPAWLAILAGLILLGIGIYIIKGGNITW